MKTPFHIGFASELYKLAAGGLFGAPSAPKQIRKPKTTPVTVDTHSPKPGAPPIGTPPAPKPNPLATPPVSDDAARSKAFKGLASSGIHTPGFGVGDPMSPGSGMLSSLARPAGHAIGDFFANRKIQSDVHRATGTTFADPAKLKSHIDEKKWTPGAGTLEPSVQKRVNAESATWAKKKPEERRQLYGTSIADAAQLGTTELPPHGRWMEQQLSGGPAATEGSAVATSKPKRRAGSHMSRNARPGGLFGM